jgi:hypothetical protein
MLAILIYLVEALRRMFHKLGRGVSVVAESFDEAQKMRRATPRTYIDE